eukprot:TRINITY_DN1320_c0_g1_i2.p1 TRINITY_DN1320_c0_g1~~TRINITY_DN1320_c0_g1_i2.p1  ORF type:complete len:234 (+),score=29.26 TRINITY_DN1320_c0_g1_i2:75-704(+)
MSAILWLHGLGDTGNGWMGAFRQVEQMKPGVRLVHPTSPVRAVTCNGGSKCTSWFDIEDIPVDMQERDPPKDIDDSVQIVHGLLGKLESEGVPAENIVLGGFSQGGAMSLLAGLGYPRKLGGIISISGWCVRRQDVTSWMSEEGRKTPTLMCCGDGDPVVSFNITKGSADLLQDVLGDTLEVMTPKRPMHQPNQDEMQRVFQFMIDHLP